MTRGESSVTGSGLNPAPGRALALLVAGFLIGCSQAPVGRHADVIVVGAGIAGLSAALEASANGARVILVEANSVGGGHAVKAGGFALVGTELQRARGIDDEPALAYTDWVKRGDDPDPYWSFRYAESSAEDVYDWLTGNGVEFRAVLPTPDDSVPRFHFTRGTAVNAVVPLLRKALYDTDIELLWSTRAVALARSRGRVNGVLVRDERSGQEQLLRSGAVILTTGGLQNNLDVVRANWSADKPLPPALLKGAGRYATGDGHRMAEWAGADMVSMDRQVTFYNGVPDPRDPSGERGFVAQNARAIWVNSYGHRFVNETVDARGAEEAINAQDEPVYWLVFDAAGARRFMMRDAPWLNGDTVRREVLDNPGIVAKANDISELATLAGLPPHGLRTTIQTWNRMVFHGEDFKFGRFSDGAPDRNAAAIAEPPYYAVRMHALTRKNMGGPAINVRAAVTGTDGQPIPGLYAAGELTGVAGINGRYGGNGTFLGPSVFLGRIAGESAARAALAGSAADGSEPAYRKLKPQTPIPAAPGKPGFWHFDVAHSLVSERGYACESCHSATNPMQPTLTRNVLLARLDTCTQCH